MATGALALLAALALLSGCGQSATRATPPRATATRATPAATTPALARPTFETGIVFPRWGTTDYGPQDAEWAPGVAQAHQQTGARWLEMVVNLYQDTAGSTTVYAGPGTPTPDAVASGILTAKEAGFHVFVVPLLGVAHDPQTTWGGSVHFDDPARTQAWFDSYWQALRPYAQVAAETGADQMAIGTELKQLEEAPASYWDQLIGRIHGVFPRALTYDMNWDVVGSRPLPWMRNAALTYLGVSMYQSITPSPQRLTEDQISAVWRQTLLPELDALSVAAGKPALLSEIGYRHKADALYQPWAYTSSTPDDPDLQAAAYSAAVKAAFSDTHVAGIFFWAWGTGDFDPSNRPAAAALRALYLSPAA